MTKIKLMTHQQAALEKSRTERNLALFHDVGTGKTITAISIYIDKLSQYDRFLRCVIFAPKAVLGGWKKEFALFSDVDHSRVTVLTGPTKDRLKLFKEKTAHFSSQIFILNYESLLSKDLQSAIVKWKPEILICDEAHRLKSHESKRSKLMEPIARGTLHNYLLTGTPIVNSEMDIFQQYKILDGGETFGDKFFVFRTVYFEDENASWSHRDNHFPKFVPKKFTHEKMKRLIAASAVQANKKDCIDLPPLVYRTVEVELSPEQKRTYKEMKEEFITFIRDNQDKPRAVMAELAMHKALRLQQIVSGFVRVEKTETEPEKDIRLKSNPRLEILQDLLTDIVPAEKVIVWCCFRENYKMITEMLEKEKWSYAMVVGGMSDVQAEIDRFQTDPSCRVLIANQQAGGSGLNLQQASTAIYYSKSFSLEHDIQSLARCYRKGSDIHQKVTRIDLVAPETIDVLVNEALKRKQSVADLISDWSNI